MFVEVKRNGEVAGALVQGGVMGEWYFVATSEENDTFGHDFTVEGDIGGVVTVTVLDGVTDTYEFGLKDDLLKFFDEDIVKLEEL